MHTIIRRTLVALELLVGTLALLGGIALLVRTDGSLLRLDVAAMGGVFKTFLWPGVVLSALGVLQLAAAWEMVKHMHLATTLSALAGGCLVLWVAAQMIFIGPLSIQQALFTLIGVVMYTLAMELVHEGEGPHWLPD